MTANVRVMLKLKHDDSIHVSTHGSKEIDLCDVPTWRFSYNAFFVIFPTTLTHTPCLLCSQDQQFFVIYHNYHPHQPFHIPNAEA
jgi:hypothetical protein